MPAAYDPASWRDFYALVGAGSAALLGLLFVALSLHVEQVIQHPMSVGRAGSALSELLDLFLIAILVLIPGQPRWLLGGELMLLGAVSLGYWVSRQMRTLPTFLVSPSRLGQIAAFDAASVAIMLSGLGLIAGGLGGLYLLVPVVIFQVLHSILSAGLILIMTQVEVIPARVRQ